jgi:hypothetical protein
MSPNVKFSGDMETSAGADDADADAVFFPIAITIDYSPAGKPAFVVVLLNVFA